MNERNYIKVGGGGDMLRAIAAKQVDFGGLGNPPTAIGVTRGLPIQGTMVLNMLGAAIVFPFKSFQDLIFALFRTTMASTAPSILRTMVP